MKPKLAILCADTYGKEFFRLLLLRLKDDRLLPNFSFALDRFYGPCNTKLERQMRVFAYVRQINAFLVFVDADGKPQEKIRKDVACHVEPQLIASTRIIIFRYEIEDWICISKGIRIKDEKPSIILSRKEKYEKYKLPEYAAQLDIRKLTNECESFREFLEFAQSIR